MESKQVIHSFCQTRVKYMLEVYFKLTAKQNIIVKSSILVVQEQKTVLIIILK